MKKIFAIALALVMVLSMASAFASECNVGPYDWTCSTSSTNCGKATVEIIPYVKTNAACDEFSYVESDCAAAINGENVYYAIKLTIDEDIDTEWWNAAKLSFEVNGMEQDWDIDDWAKPTLNADDEEDGWVYYHKINTGWVEATEDSDFDIADVINKSVVKEYAKAEVCLTLKSENKFTKATVGDYFVTWVDNPQSDGGKWNNALVFESDDGIVRLFMDKDDKVQKITAELKDGAWTTDAALINDVLASYNFGCGYGLCITYDAVKANFGWKDKVESCFAWKTQNAMAVVDSECVVAIPKTGDASVLAWLF